MQVLDEKMPKLNIEESFEESSRSIISIPKNIKYNYKFDFWKPFNDEMSMEYPLAIKNSLLGSFVMLGKSRVCKCGFVILPIPSQKMRLPEICPKCSFSMSKPVQEKQSDLKRSSTLQRLDALLTEAFKKYQEHADFREKDDYTENYFHKKNHQIYLTETIIQDAAEIVSCIESLIAYDSIPSRYFKRNGISYSDIFKKILDNEGILRLKPHYDLLTMASSVIKAKQVMIRPLMIGSRNSPSNVVNQPIQNKV